jgi:hypothetical protein
MGGSIQGTSLSLDGSVSTFAGTVGSAGYSDGIGTEAKFDSPQHVTTDGSNLYVADWANHTIRKVVIGTGVVTTLAGAAGISGSVDGIGVTARLNFPWGITTDGINLYVTEYGSNLIRKILIATGSVTTLSPILQSGAAAYFYHPAGITTDGNNLYIAEYDNHTITKIKLATGIVTTIAGVVGTTGSNDGIGSTALFYNPLGITTDGENLYVTDYNNHTIRKIIIETGAVSTIAGVTGSFGAIDGHGTSDTFKYPCGITTDGRSIYVADYGNNIIRKIVIATGAVNTIAGTAGIGSHIDGPRAVARFSLPSGIITDGTNIYVTEVIKHNIRKVL